MVERKYTSLISGRNCTAAQFIVEMMVSRQALKKGIDLPDKFWNLKEWKSEYKRQIIKAHSYLKIYEPEIIIKTLSETDNKWINSLFYTRLNEMFQKTKIKFDRESKETTLEYTENVESQPAKKFGNKQSKLNKIREIENG